MCKFVSSRGLLRSTGIHNQTVQSSSTVLEMDQYAKMDRGSVVYVCNSAIRTFVREVLPSVKEPFVLVSGDSDNDMPYGLLSEAEFQLFINDDRLQHWFCQNLLITHPKMTHIPIGLDYHTMSKVGEQHPWGIGATPQDQEATLTKAIHEAPPFQQRYLYCYSNFHHKIWGIGERGDRKEVVEKVGKEIVMYDPTFTPREIAWNRQSYFMFVLSPKGGGHDCHRTWEALCLGCIPIVKRSGLSPLFDGLPVLQVDDWSDVTGGLLTKTLQEHGTKSYSMEKLTLAYWQNLFHQHSKACFERTEYNFSNQ